MLIFSLFLVKSWIQSSIQNRRITVCTTQAMNISDGNYLHFPRHLSCVTLLFSLSSRREFVFAFWLKICLTISSPQALISSAQIPWLPGASPFFQFSWSHLAKASLVISGILVSSSVSLMCTSVLLSIPYSSCSLSSQCRTHQRHWRCLYLM